MKDDTESRGLPQRNRCKHGRREPDRIYCKLYGGTCGINPQSKCADFKRR